MYESEGNKRRDERKKKNKKKKKIQIIKKIREKQKI